MTEHGPGVDWRYAAFALSLAPFWALFAQLFAAMPILIAETGGTASWAQSVILVNGLVGFAVVPIVLPVIARFGPRVPLAAGCALAGASVALLGLPAQLGVLMALVVALSVAETLVTSAADVLTARHADGRDVARRFGYLAVGAGIGTSIGAGLGVMATEDAPLVLIGLGLFGCVSCVAAILLPQNGQPAGQTRVAPCRP
jgi:MFS family permease